MSSHSASSPTPDVLGPQLHHQGTWTEMPHGSTALIGAVIHAILGLSTPTSVAGALDAYAHWCERHGRPSGSGAESRLRPGGVEHVRNPECCTGRLR